jgi:hypothetical protein
MGAQIGLRPEVFLVAEVPPVRHHPHDDHPVRIRVELGVE